MAFIGALVAAGLSYAAQDSATGAARSSGRQAAALQARELALAESQDARADALFDEYQQTYLPRERELVDSAFNDETSPEAAAGRATTDVRSASEQRRETGLRDARALGINPASGAYAALENSRGLKDAALEVSARDTARRGARSENFQRQSAVLSMGRNLPSTAGALTNSAISSVGGLADAAQARTDNFNRLAGQAGQAFGSAVGDLASAGMDSYRNRRPQGKMIDVPIARESNLAYA